LIRACFCSRVSIEKYRRKRLVCKVKNFHKMRPVKASPFRVYLYLLDIKADFNIMVERKGDKDLI